MRKTLCLFLLMIACTSKNYRLPASINDDGTPIKMKCGVKCAFGPVSKSFFRVKTIKVKYASVDKLAPEGIVTGKTVSDLDTYCQRYSQMISKKLKQPMGYITLNTKAKVYHGQLLKTQDDGKVSLAEKRGFALRSDNVCH